MTASNRPAHALPVFTSPMLRVVNGANIGDGLSFATELQLEDSYALSPVLDPPGFRLPPPKSTGSSSSLMAPPSAPPARASCSIAASP
nr:hypothetical protein [Aquicoccus sp. G2-2]MEA1113273.1 hypothetical protein [Aquicoccus sp. G2-2]